MTAIEVPARPQDRVRRRESTKRDWGKVTLAGYYLIFLVFLYGPMIVMAILSFQGYYGGITFPFVGPFGLNWWRSLVDSTVANTPTHAADIQTAAVNSLELSLAAGLIVAFLAFTLSMAFRRRWRFKTDSAVFYIVMLALMTPGFLLAVGTQLFWSYLGFSPTIWKTALGANVVWGIPFGFLVMLAVWNRYDQRIEESARDLGADQRRTFVEVTPNSSSTLRTGAPRRLRRVDATISSKPITNSVSTVVAVPSAYRSGLMLLVNVIPPISSGNESVARVWKRTLRS